MLSAASLRLTVGLILADWCRRRHPGRAFALKWDVTHAPVALMAVGASAALGALIGLRRRVVGHRAAMLIAATPAV